MTWPQQIEADLIKTAVVRLDRIFRVSNMKARIVMMIHDALWVESPEAGAEEVRSIMQSVINSAGELDVPLEVDFS